MLGSPSKRGPGAHEVALITHLLSKYGYLAIFVGTFLEGETILVLAGYAAHRGYLSLGWVIAAAFAGSLAGDQLYFHLGRSHGQRLLNKHPSWASRMAKVQGHLQRHATPYTVSFRFFYGLRTVSPIAIGLTNVSGLRFLILNTCGAAVWAVAFGGAGYVFGAGIETLLGNIQRYEQLLLVFLVVGAIVVWGIQRWRERVSSQKSPGTPTPEP